MTDEIRRVVRLEDGSYRIQFHDGHKVTITPNVTKGYQPKPGDKYIKEANGGAVIVPQHETETLQ